MRLLLAALLLCSTGCVTSADRALDAATKAETRVAASVAAAASSVAKVASATVGTLQGLTEVEASATALLDAIRPGVAGVLSDTQAATSALRMRAEAPVPDWVKLGFGGLGAGLVLLLLHQVWAHHRLRRHLA